MNAPRQDAALPRESAVIEAKNCYSESALIFIQRASFPYAGDFAGRCLAFCTASWTASITKSGRMQISLTHSRSIVPFGLGDFRGETSTSELLNRALYHSSWP